MKLSFFILFSVLLAGCNPAPQNLVKDPRPTDQLAFVKKFRLADSVYKSYSNEIKKSEALVKGETEISDFVSDELKMKVTNWIATVNEIELAPSSEDFIKVTLLIPKGVEFDDEEQKYPQFSTLVLHALVNVADTSLKNSLKELEKGDHVFVSGKFERDDSSKYLFEANMDDKENTFSNPIFNFTINSITKRK